MENSYGSQPGFEYPSQTQERQLIEEAEHAKSSEVREAILNELANRRARFQVEYEQDRQRAIRTGREPLGNDPFDPRHGYDKFAEWLSRTYGTEQERNLDPRRFEYSTEGGDRYGRERDMIDQQRRLIELNEMGAKTGKLGMSKEEFIKAKREAMERNLPEWVPRLDDFGLQQSRRTLEWMESRKGLDHIDPLDEIIRSIGKEEPKRPPTGRTRFPLVERTSEPGSYFETYKLDPGVTSPEEQSKINYQKLLNPKPKPSKGGKFVPIGGSLPEPTGTPWREATASQINDRLNQMPSEESDRIRKTLGI